MYKEAVLANWHSFVFHILNEIMTSEYGFAYLFLSFFSLNPKQQARPILDKKKKKKSKSKKKKHVRNKRDANEQQGC